MGSASLRNSLLLSTLVVVVLALVASFSVPALATSRQALRRIEPEHTGFKVVLKHIDSGKNLTKFERLQRGIARGQHRLQKLSKTEMEAESPIHAGNGEFLMQLAIGTPAEGFSAIMDTGSDLIWTQCEPCSQCFDQPTPIFNPRNSSTFATLPCSSQTCRALPSTTCSVRGDGSCEYFYSYGDYSSTQGVMATETFTFGDSSGDGHGQDAISISKVAFGCGKDNEGGGFSQGAGLVGLGRGPLSLVSQLGVPEFSYCLTSIDDDSKISRLFIGRQAINITTTTTTAPAAASPTATTSITIPLIQNPSQPSFYYLPLQGISVGGTRLPINPSTFSLGDDGSGGLIIDSGTTITNLEESAFESVRREFISQTKLPVDSSGWSGLDLCFTLPSGTTQFEVPRLVLHFEGGSDLDLPGNNYMIGDSTLGLICLAMGASTGISILGNVQQQNMLVVHDLEKETLSFIPTQCDQL
ncbi:hypothetical protein SAY87_002318 [Trapa incisa]|uniref:Peptidase A1 domain-containing protein n=1 Tax=Trapa incisa TaxID=236973 RepID=A0AAN7JWK9_9MYRT|nr:hypothetical protein SAY87_002318 [Trapa incisa]